MRYEDHKFLCETRVVRQQVPFDQKMRHIKKWQQSFTMTDASPRVKMTFNDILKMSALQQSSNLIYYPVLLPIDCWRFWLVHLLFEVASEEKVTGSGLLAGQEVTIWSN